MCKWPLQLLTYLCLIFSFVVESKVESKVESSMFSPLAKHYDVEVVKSYPHNKAFFTQGLLYHQGFLYESIGLRGQSALLRLDLHSGEVLKRVDLDSQYFAEGLALIPGKEGGKLAQLTYTAKKGFVYQRRTMALLKTFSIADQGWGLAFVNRQDDKLLVMTDGSATLTFLDSETFEVVDKLAVKDQQGPVVWMNELEFVEGYLLANIWQSSRVAVIDIDSGMVAAYIDLSPLLSQLTFVQQRQVGTLNGIAYDAVGKRLFVTGKNWPRLFEVRLVRAAKPLHHP